VWKVIRTQGQQVLRTKGQVRLVNKLSAHIMEPDDREAQQRRNRWVAERLKAVIADGRADKPAKDAKKVPFGRGPRIVIPW